MNVLESGKGGLGEESLVKEGRGKNPVRGGGGEEGERDRDFFQKQKKKKIEITAGSGKSFC